MSSLTNKESNEVLQAADTVLSALSEYPNVRVAGGVTNRNKQIMTWRLPDASLVQMYMNPENFRVSESKQIKQTRTKGGFVIQYWGDNLTKLDLSGTTGSAGVKGINVLRDIYHSENKAFELIAGVQTNELFNALVSDSIETGVGLIEKTSETLRNRNFVLRPSLASLAVGVTLYYQGIQYRGFFTEMTTTESVQKLGLFDYTISFMATEIRGRRENFMPWHREPLADDAVGQFVNATVGSIGNAFRKMVGMPANTTPNEFHPESAPLTFGGNSLASQFGLEATGGPAATRKR